MNTLVSLITRTQSRPLFTPRVFKTVIEQSYRPIEWIIVNDNGESIDTLLEELKLQYAKQLDGIEIVLINKKSSTGMEGASNTGLEHAHGSYIKLLDDDDTLDTTCIEKQVHYMEHEKLPNEGGVICYTNNIFEKIEDNQINYLSSSPLALTLENITIADLAQHNQFTVHSFLYEKEALANIGNYNESLPVLGDWEFNLRFIMAFDIGVIPEFLVNYHIRKEGIYSSTMVNQQNRYDRYEAVIRNYFIRNKEKYGEIATAILNAQNIKQLQLKMSTIAQTINKEIQLFLDLGEGYSEENFIKFPIVENNESQIFTFNLAQYENLINFRLDPLNDSCVIEIEELKILYPDNIDLDLITRISANACIHHGKSYFFETINPVITFEGLSGEQLVGAEKLIVKIRYPHIAKDALAVSIKQIKLELDQTKVELAQTKVKLDDSNTELDQTKTELEQIKRSLSWWITQSLQKIKQILKGN